MRHRVSESIKVKFIFRDEKLGMQRIKGELAFHCSLCIQRKREREHSKGEFAEPLSDIQIWCAILHLVERYLKVKPLFD